MLCASDSITTVSIFIVMKVVLWLTDVLLIVFGQEWISEAHKLYPACMISLVIIGFDIFKG